jgi:hypothetical protein
MPGKRPGKFPPEFEDALVFPDMFPDGLEVIPQKNGLPVHPRYVSGILLRRDGVMRALTISGL